MAPWEVIRTTSAGAHPLHATELADSFDDDSGIIERCVTDVARPDHTIAANQEETVPRARIVNAEVAKRPVAIIDQ
jgi:hypothetical protein